MTLTLINTRDDNPRLRRRSPRESTGQVYYGSKLRRVLEPRPTRIERMTDWYSSRRWPAAILFALGVLVAAATIAAWVVA